MMKKTGDAEHFEAVVAQTKTMVPPQIIASDAAEILSQSEERFRWLADTAPVLISGADVDKQRTYFNQPWLDFTGRPSSSK